MSTTTFPIRVLKRLGVEVLMSEFSTRLLYLLAWADMYNKRRTLQEACNNIIP